MRINDFKKLATGNVLFNLNRVISPTLVTILYFLGLAAIIVWAVAHVFSTFRFGFGSGLWGLLEIVVFGLLAVVVLRIACEAVLVFFRTHVDEAEDYAPAHSTGSLIDDVRDALEDLADAEDADYSPAPKAPSPVAPAPRPASPPAAPVTPASVTPDPVIPDPVIPDPLAPVAEEPVVTADPESPKPASPGEKPATAP